MTNVVSIIPKLKSIGDIYVFTDNFKTYVETIRDVHYNSSSLTFEDLETAVSIASFYSRQMKKRIESLEQQLEEVK